MRRQRGCGRWGLVISSLLSVVTVGKSLPVGFDRLRNAARLEGFKHVDRLAHDWEQGAARFDRPGEGLLAVYAGDELAGIGGLTIDPHQFDLFRMRRFYVLPQFRKQGIGRALAAALLDGIETDIGVNAPQEAQPFWRAIGFEPELRGGRTHIMRRRPEA